MRAAFGEVGNVVALAVQRVDGDHRVAQVADLVKQRLEAGDLSLVLPSTSVLARTTPVP
ncbi:hypothetical protein [Micromonospora aurantiaca (nom. illeg.)]|uniref:hypothetical protein n=1 Tax=Micromonospora aurantiaca (nom. illeg.) TaxID=47850 RepID=UPI0033EEC2EB